MRLIRIYGTYCYGLCPVQQYSLFGLKCVAAFVGACTYLVLAL